MPGEPPRIKVDDARRLRVGADRLSLEGVEALRDSSQARFLAWVLGRWMWEHSRGGAGTGEGTDSPAALERWYLGSWREGRLDGFEAEARGDHAAVRLADLLAAVNRLRSGAPTERGWLRKARGAGKGGDESMRRSLVFSLVVHLLLLLAATLFARPHFQVPKPLTAIPFDFVATAAPAPALVERQRPAEPSQRPDAVPDPLKPKPKPKKVEPEPPKKEPAKKPVDKPKPQRDLPKVGSADTTQVLRSELPQVGNLKGAMQLRVEGAPLPYAYYLAGVQRKISSFWEPPAGIATAQGEVAAIVWFRIERNGSVQVNHVEEPSGMNIFDLSALRALERALPFPPLPPEYTGEYLIIHLRFVYNE